MPDGSGGAAFFGVHEIEEGHQVGAVGEAGFGALLFEAGGGGVAPATFLHEAVEEFDVFGFRLATGLKAPVEDFLVGAAFEGAGGEGFVGDSEEAADAVVEGTFAFDDADVVAWRKQALGVEADFVEDAAEDHDAADGVARGADGEGHGGWVNRDDRFVKGFAIRVARRKVGRVSVSRRSPALGLSVFAAL